MPRLIVLAGNPNVGKSRLFMELTGHYAHVSNFPGTTVEIRMAPLGSDSLCDTPGIYGLGRFSEDEAVALQTILDADVVVNVVDATHLPRDLFLTLQLCELGKPMCIVLNFMDEVRRNDAFVDGKALAAELGVPVIEGSAATGENMVVLRNQLKETLPVAPPHLRLAMPAGSWSPADSLLFYEEDPVVMNKVGHAPPLGSRERLYMKRREEADGLAQKVWRPPLGPQRWSFRLDAFLLSPMGGALAILLLIAAIYYGIGIVVAGVVVTTAESVLKLYVVGLLEQVTGLWIPRGTIGFQLLFGEYGMIRAGLVAIGGLLLPLVASFNLVLAILEGTGYLPRLATLLDRLFLSLGLNGRAVIPLVLGFGCVTMATLSTRVLSTKRERSIATVLLAWTIPCSAQMGVVVGLMSGLGFGYALSYAVIILGLFVLVGTLMDRTLPGQPTPLLLDLPPLRWPKLRDILLRTEGQVKEFLREATPLFVVGTGLIELAHLFGVLRRVNHFLSPIFQQWLGLPQQATGAFVLGFIRRDFGVAEFYQMHLSPHQVLTGAVTLTLFVPCVASTLVILKERGAFVGAVIWAGSIAVALGCGSAVAHWWPI